MVKQCSTLKRGMGFFFAWDPIKAHTNLATHGVSLEAASTVFGGARHAVKHRSSRYYSSTWRATEQHSVLANRCARVILALLERDTLCAAADAHGVG